MGLKTTSATEQERKLTTDERRKKVMDLRTYHQAYFDSIGNPHAIFRAKMRYGKPPYSKFYAAEINGDAPIYIEWTSRNVDPEDDRRLYRYDPNPNYRQDYSVTVDANGQEWFLIPMERFTLVKHGEKESQLPKEVVEQRSQQPALDFDFELVNPDEDCPMENITLRDWAAIILRAPVSRKEWLNKLIKDSCQK